MRRITVLLAALVLFGGSEAARGSGNPALSIGPFGSTQLDQPVESQTDAFTNAEHAACPGGFSWWPCDSIYWPRTDGAPTGPTWVVNHTGPCSWDPDDRREYRGDGYLSPGASASVTYCLVAEPTGVVRTVYDMTADWSISPKQNGFVVTAPSPSLVVTACYSPQGRCFTLSARASGRTWSYAACVRLQYDEGDPNLQPIPDSGKGGIGLVTQLAFTVANPTTHQVKSIVADTQQDNGLDPCQPPGPYVSDYPFQVAV